MRSADGADSGHALGGGFGGASLPFRGDATVEINDVAGDRDSYAFYSAVLNCLKHFGF